MLFAIDFTQANERRDVISRTAGFSGLQTAFLEPIKCSTGAPPSPTFLLPNKWLDRALLSVQEKEGHHLMQLPLQGKAVALKLSIYFNKRKVWL